MLVFETRTVIGRHLTAISCSTHPKQPQWALGPVRKGVGQWILFRVVATPVPASHLLLNSSQRAPVGPGGETSKGWPLPWLGWPRKWPKTFCGHQMHTLALCKITFILYSSSVSFVRSSFRRNVSHLCITHSQNFHSAPCRCVTAAALNYYKIINATWLHKKLSQQQ